MVIEVTDFSNHDKSNYLFNEIFSDRQPLQDVNVFLRFVK